MSTYTGVTQILATSPRASGNVRKQVRSNPYSSRAWDSWLSALGKADGKACIDRCCDLEKCSLQYLIAASFGAAKDLLIYCRTYLSVLF
jgi:hypothetical protein